MCTGDGDFDSEPPPPSLVGIEDGDANVVIATEFSTTAMLLGDGCLLNLVGDGVMDRVITISCTTGADDGEVITSALSRTPTLLGDGDRCLLLSLMGDGVLDLTTLISDSDPGDGGFVHWSSTLAYPVGVGDGDLIGDHDRMSARTLDVDEGRAGDTPHRLSCGSGGEITSASPSRSHSGSSSARHTGHDECALSHRSMHPPWKKCLHAGSTRTTSPSSSSCRHTTHSTAAIPCLLPLLILPPSPRPLLARGDADVEARTRYVNVGSAAISSALSPTRAPPPRPCWSWRYSARRDRP
jgi:hypothetical protein